MKMLNALRYGILMLEFHDLLLISKKKKNKIDDILLEVTENNLNSSRFICKICQSEVFRLKTFIDISLRSSLDYPRSDEVDKNKSVKTYKISST